MAVEEGFFEPGPDNFHLAEIKGKIEFLGVHVVGKIETLSLLFVDGFCFMENTSCLRLDRCAIAVILLSRKLLNILVRESEPRPTSGFHKIGGGQCRVVILPNTMGYSIMFKEILIVFKHPAEAMAFNQAFLRCQVFNQVLVSIQLPIPHCGRDLISLDFLTMLPGVSILKIAERTFTGQSMIITFRGSSVSGEILIVGFLITALFHYRFLTLRIGTHVLS